MLSEEEKRIDDESLKPIDQVNTESESSRIPFYYTKVWLAVWSLLIWPIGIFMLWRYLDDTQKSKLPRTQLIKKRPEDL
ncbi:hypothetical protein GH810_13325 [Acetobacterium paludosum]|uniref:Uncharacterized protein n=1 Tax=Acetobacterium paludosum TaxID=52693 RepID=A0A923KY73_9FIRM|nr:hypothetical protein [Acetobacterium paludosum]MBC3889296.1 hypothetical protein [Acetobacterium paludosum]